MKEWSLFKWLRQRKAERELIKADDYMQRLQASAEDLSGINYRVSVSGREYLEIWEFRELAWQEFCRRKIAGEGTEGERDEE